MLATSPTQPREPPLEAGRILAAKRVAERKPRERAHDPSTRGI
jgi:hypothetical protein